MSTGDQIGRQFASVNGVTTTTGPMQQAIENNDARSGYLSTGTYQWPSYQYTYTWPYTHDAHAREQIARLEGEVKALREMVAALVAGHTPIKSAPRKRAKK